MSKFAPFFWPSVWFLYFFAAIMIQHGWTKGHLIVCAAYVCAWFAGKFIFGYEMGQKADKPDNKGTQ